LPIEVAGLTSIFQDVRKYSNDRQIVIEGMIGSKLVVMIVTGPGRKLARKGAELLLAGHRPRWMISAGFGGLGIPPWTDEVVFADEVMDTDGVSGGSTLSFIPGPREPERLESPRGSIRSRRSHRADRRGEGRVARQHGADVVDMESSAVASLCGEPWGTVRRFA